MGTVFKINGKTVTPEEFASHPPLSAPLKAGDRVMITNLSLRPGKQIESISMAVNPKDVAAAQQHADENGIRVHFKPNGSPVYDNFAEMDRHAAACGMKRNDRQYGSGRKYARKRTCPTTSKAAAASAGSGSSAKPTAKRSGRRRTTTTRSRR